MTPRHPSRAGIAAGNVVLGLAGVAMVASLLFPTLSARSFRNDVSGAVAEVEATLAAARAVVAESGSWPAAADPGVIPGELRSRLAPDTSWVRPKYTLRWHTLELVTQTEVRVDPDPGAAPQDAEPDSAGTRLVASVEAAGALALHTGDLDLLAELYERFGPERSFVRDTVWTLVTEAASQAAR